MISIFNEWTDDELYFLEEYLKSVSDEKVKYFNMKLVPNAGKIYGVRVPTLREIAKSIASGNWESFLSYENFSSYEHTMLYGMVLGYAKMDFIKFIHYIPCFVSHITNWAVCDSCCSTFKKQIGKNKEDMLKIIKVYAKSNKEFDVRFAIIVAMDSFIDDDYIDEVIDMCKNNKNTSYYAQMAVAWALSECFVNYEEKTYSLIESKTLDTFTQNKTIQKIRESYRVSQESKDSLLQLKKM